MTWLDYWSGWLLMTSLLFRKASLLDLMEFFTVFTDVVVALVRSFSFVLIMPYWREVMFLIVLVKIGPSLSLRLLVLMTLRIIRSRDAIFHRHCATVFANSLLLLFLSRLSVVRHEMHSLLSEMPLPHVVGAPPNSGVLCRGISQCHHSWISITHVVFVGARRRQFLMARGVRQGCLANGFLFAMAFDPIFRWLQESIILMNVDNLESLQLTQRPYIEDLAIASSSFRELMFARAPAFRTIDCIVGSNLNFRECCWVQTGNEDHDSRRT